MDRKIKRRISSLDPKFRKKVEELFEVIMESISLLYEEATHDEKTGLYNSKFFENVFDLGIERAKRTKEDLSLIIIDIDFFKKINDTYGHIRADELLGNLSSALKRHIRKPDILARFGGEEFIILLPATNLVKARKLTIRLRKVINSDSVLKKHGLTVSGGVTQFRGKNDTKRKMKLRVDKALYKAKKSGRNNFVVIE
ncbi:MAG TPA: GGDEF domain-containing protein [Candidatus Pacearchaeota archaeon]|nr:response regulator PleD [archaeon BMS3Abin17]HDK42772.1 GGDEF domain-containing protein [Candidatus Pacearchaeota archaeon]HDZ61053.1 GGDEF domain-containing protein [Candidatus Pacearchaeota archaeon]